MQDQSRGKKFQFSSGVTIEVIRTLFVNGSYVGYDWFAVYYGTNNIQVVSRPFPSRRSAVRDLRLEVKKVLMPGFKETLDRLEGRPPLLESLLKMKAKMAEHKSPSKLIMSEATYDKLKDKLDRGEVVISNRVSGVIGIGDKSEN